MHRVQKVVVTDGQLIGVPMHERSPIRVPNTAEAKRLATATECAAKVAGGMVPKTYVDGHALHILLGRVLLGLLVVLAVAHNPRQARLHVAVHPVHLRHSLAGSMIRMGERVCVCVCVCVCVRAQAYMHLPAACRAGGRLTRLLTGHKTTLSRL